MSFASFDELHKRGLARAVFRPGRTCDGDGVGGVRSLPVVADFRMVMAAEGEGRGGRGGGGGGG